MEKFYGQFVSIRVSWSQPDTIAGCALIERFAGILIGSMGAHNNADEKMNHKFCL
jgi:hypothetical protein